MEELRSAIMANHDAGKSQIPWLIYPISPIEQQNDTFYVLEKNTRYGMLNLTQPNTPHILDLPDHVVPGTCCVGVYGTWMLMCYDNATIFLLNPFTGKRIDLPSKKICIPTVSQFVVSENMVVMVIYGGSKKLAYCRPDYESWKSIKFDGDRYSDLVYFDDRFLALDERKGVLLMNYDGGSDIKTMRLKYPTGKAVDDYYYRREEFHMMKSLVCWSEKLLMVEWMENKKDKTTISCVWELDTSIGEWRIVQDLGDYAVFVGRNYSCAVPCSCSEGHWKKNSVYYTDHWNKEEVVFHEINRKDLCDGTIQHLCYGRSLTDIGTQFFAGSGAWIVPSLS